MTRILTSKQERFISEYLVDLNGKQAAIRSGYSAKTAEQQAARLLSNVKVAEEIDKAKQTRAKRVEVTQDEVVQGLAKIAFGNIQDFAEWDQYKVKLAVSTTLARETASCVSEVRPTKYGVSIKLHDKVRALQLLGEHLGIFKIPTVPKGAVKDLTSRCKRLRGVSRLETRVSHFLTEDDSYTEQTGYFLAPAFLSNWIISE